MGEGFWFYTKAVSSRSQLSNVAHSCSIEGGWEGLRFWLRTPLAGGSSPEQQFTALCHRSLHSRTRGQDSTRVLWLTTEANSFCLCRWVKLRGDPPFATLVSLFMKSRHRRSSTMYQSLSQSLEDIHKNNPPDCKSCKLSSFAILPCLRFAFLGDGLTVRPVKSNVGGNLQISWIMRPKRESCLKFFFFSLYLSLFF